MQNSLNFQKRLEVLKKMDQRLSAPFSEKDPEVAQSYQGKVDAVIEDIGKIKVARGMVVWKLYASSFIVKTPEMVFAVDLCEGPNRNILGGPVSPFCFKQQQRRRLARLIDCSFHTHHHFDHVSYQMAEELARNGRKVIVTPQHLEYWKDVPFRKRLTVFDGGKNSFKVGTLAVRVHRGWQSVSPEVQCHAYLITVDGKISLLFKGDLFDGDEFSRVLGAWKKNGVRIDLFLSSLWTASGRDIVRETTRLFDPFFIPAHEWEFTHRKEGQAGVATQSYGQLFAKLKNHVRRGKAAVLMWGERLRYDLMSHLDFDLGEK
ncbi:MAG: MBL fold metallo-hydrolase [Verrucomicrobiae bacterium]|nr:MBL fold metallo-hydrolase [Verrucomicrobiae bacterium]